MGKTIPPRIIITPSQNTEYDRRYRCSSGTTCFVEGDTIVHIDSERTTKCECCGANEIYNDECNYCGAWYGKYPKQKKKPIPPPTQIIREGEHPKRKKFNLFKWLFK